MTKLTNILDLSQWTLIGVSISDINNLLSTILLIISIILGVISIIIKVKNYAKDGKIDEEELKDIMNDVDKLNENIKEHKDGSN